MARSTGEPKLNKAWILAKSTVLSFIEDDALSKGAAIAFYTVTSIAPILLIVVAIAGLAFGHEAAQNGIVSQLSGLMGKGKRAVSAARPGGRAKQVLRHIGDADRDRDHHRDGVGRVR